MILADSVAYKAAKRFRVMFAIKDIFFKQSIRNLAADYGIELREIHKDDTTYIFIKDAKDKESFEGFLVECLDNSVKKVGFFKERIWNIRVNCITDLI